MEIEDEGRWGEEEDEEETRQEEEKEEKGRRNDAVEEIWAVSAEKVNDEEGKNCL